MATKQPAGLSLGKILSIVGAVGVALAAFPAFWTFSDHWMNRSEITNAMAQHAAHDAGVQMWTQYGFADVRSQFLADHAFECDAKRMMSKTLNPIDAAICSRYETELKTKKEEAMMLKQKALEATKEITK